MTILLVSQAILTIAMLATLGWDLWHFKVRPQTQLVWVLWFIGEVIISAIQLSPLAFWYLFLIAAMLGSRWALNQRVARNGDK